MRCAQVRAIARSEIDWDCDVSFLERSENLGCGRGPSSAISWFFESVEEGVILEDDCLPSPSFLPFCSQVLERFREERRIAHVGGFNCQFGRRRGDASYYFSRYFHSWGWATWRRAWQSFDFGMRDYEEFLAAHVLENLFERPAVRDFWKRNFAAVLSGRDDIWDYQWVYCNFKEDRLAVVPNQNMIENIGFGVEATHTSEVKTRLPAVDESSRLDTVHPKYIIPCRAADDFTYRKHLGLGAWHDVKLAVKLGLESTPTGKKILGTFGRR